MIEKILDQETIVAIIVRHTYAKDDITFFTPEDFSQQLAYMKRPKNYKITPHIHCRVNREVQLTQEVLVIRKGKVQIDFYSEEKKYLQSAVLKTGDVILLAAGGHGLTFLEQSEIIEVKQGPYLQDKDKIRFDHRL